MATTGHTIPRLDRKALREFGLTTGGILVALFGLLLPWLFGAGWPLWPWVVAAPLVALSLVRPLWLRGVYRGWMRFGMLAGRVTTPVILGVVFFVLIYPMAVARRLAGRDSMSRSFAPGDKSYRVKSEKTEKHRMEKPF